VQLDRPLGSALQTEIPLKPAKCDHPVHDVIAVAPNRRFIALANAYGGYGAALDHQIESGEWVS
jgi:hypothetical protein